MKNDAQIQTDVQNQLKWEPQLNAAEIGVAVNNGIVTLSGIVDTYPKKMTAERITKNVIGVKAVALDIQVGISPVNRKSDTEIAEACVNALRWDSSVPDDKIKVRVENGTVSIEGTVEWGYQRLAAKNAIVKLTGVKGVNNMIVVKQKPSSIDIKQRHRGDASGCKRSGNRTAYATTTHHQNAFTLEIKTFALHTAHKTCAVEHVAHQASVTGAFHGIACAGHFHCRGHFV